MYDLIDGTVDPGTFSSSDDVWALMASPNPARFTTLTSAGGSITVDTCPNAYTNLNGRLPAQLTRIQGKLAFQLNPTLPAATANAAIAGQIQQAYLKNSIATAAATAADLIRQNAVLNAINDTSNIIGQKVNDPAAMVLAVGRAQSVAQQNAAWLNAGKVAEQALPVFRNVIEAITYALFPLLVLLMLLTSGRETMLAFKGYAAVLIWIQLWPPLYAVLNYMASIYAAYDLAAAADLGSGAKALSLQTASTIYSRAISGEAVVGYRPHPCLEIQLGPLHLPDVPWPLEEQCRQKQCRPGDGVTVVAVDRAHQVANLIRFDDRRDVPRQHRLQCAAQIRSGAALTTSGGNAVSKHLPAGFEQRVRQFPRATCLDAPQRL